MVYPIFRQTLCLLFLSHSRAATQVARSIPPRRITGAWRWRHPLWKPSRRLKIARNPRWHRSLDGSKKQKKTSSIFWATKVQRDVLNLKKKFRTANLFSASTSIIIPITIKSETQRHWDIGQDLGTLDHSCEAWMVIKHPYCSWFHIISFGPTPYVPSYMGLMEYGHPTITKWIPKKQVYSSVQQ